MSEFLTLLTFVASSAICVRLLTYRRPAGVRRRWGVGLCAWVLIACAGGLALQILVLGKQSETSVLHLGILIVLAVLSFRARGNVARILKVD